MFTQGQEFFEAGEYEAALSKFEQAYELSQRPMLLFNIGSTLDRLRREEEAVTAFQRYLDEEPDAPDRVEIEARLRILRGAIEERRLEEEGRVAEAERVRQLEAERAAAAAAAAEARANPNPPVVIEPQEESGGLHPAVFYSLAGVAVVAGGLSVWTGLRTASLNDDYVAYAGSMGATLPIAQAMHDDAKKWQNITNALFGVTAAFGISAVVVAILTDWGGSDDAEQTAATSLLPSISVGDGELQLSLAGRF